MKMIYFMLQFVFLDNRTGTVLLCTEGRGQFYLKIMTFTLPYSVFINKLRGARISTNKPLLDFLDQVMFKRLI